MSEGSHEIAEQLRTVARYAPVGMALKDAAGRVLWSNPALRDMLGYGEEELRGMFRTEFTHPEDTGEDARLYEELLRGERDSFRLEKRYVKKDGRAIWGRLSIFRVEEATDLVLVVVEDDEARKGAEDELATSERRFRTVIEQAPLCIHVFAPDGRSLRANSAWNELWDLGAGGEQNNPNIYEDEQLRATGLVPYIEESRQKGAAVTTPPLLHDPARTGREGHRRWLEASVYPVRDEEGFISEMTLLLDDVTERVRAERALAASELRLEGSFRDAPIGMALVSPDGLWMRVNPALCEIVGYPQEELLGKAFQDITHPDDVENDVGLVRQVLSGQIESYQMEKRYLHKDGRVVWVLLSVSLVRNEESEPSYFISQIQDITERKRDAERLRDAEERYRTLVEQIPAVTYVDPVSAAGTSHYTSPQIERMLGYAPEEWLTGRLWPERLHPDDRTRVLAADERFEAGDEEEYSEEYRLLAKDGSVVWVREDAVLLRNGEGEPLFWQGVIFDVTVQKEAEQRLREAEERYRALVENVPAAAYTQEVGEYQTASYVSPRIEDLTGHRPGEFEADPDLWYGVVHTADRRTVAAEDERTEETGETFRMEYRILHSDGRVVWVRDESVLVRDEAGTPLYWQGVMSDITDRKALEERLKHQALHDPLTNLPNRLLLEDRLHHVLERTKRGAGEVAVLFVDLDNFKVVNDSLGHEAGDRLLVVVAKRLLSVVRPEDTIARLGGDEFIFLLEGAGLKEANAVAERILARLGTPVALAGREVFVTPSIGVALSRANATRPEDLLRNADLAMYRAKRGGKARYAVFEEGMGARALERLELEQGLRRALELDEFVVHYQPKVSLESGRLVGFEALVRWEHPDRGLTLPGEFVPVAEETGLIVPIGEAVLEEACRRAVGWHGRRPQDPPAFVCVNLSAKQFREPGLLETVSRILGETGLEPGRLFLEVTESTAMEDAPTTAAALEALGVLGVRAIIDDFGTGYSSLSYLERFPVDYVKIDRSFVGKLGRDPSAAALTKGVIDLAHALGLKVIAEGVETGEQRDQLRDLGCDLAQGYYFSEPLTDEAAGKLYEASAGEGTARQSSSREVGR